MSKAIDKLKSVLDMQLDSDWPTLYYEQEQGEKYRKVRLLDLEVVFVFDLSGNLVGAYNYKQ